MTQYFPYGVKLSKGQMEKLSRAYVNKSPITLRLEKSDLKGNDEIMLTKTQIKRIQKAMKMNKGVDIKISKSQIRKVARHGGSLWSSLTGIASKALPMVMPLAKKAAAPLATGALSGLASLGVNKLLGGHTGRFLIPDSKVKQLIQYKEYLTPKQKQDIINALQTGSGVHIKPTKRQIGQGWGTILASIGIPMLLDAVMGKGLQIDSNRSRSRRSLPVHVPKQRNTLTKDGGQMIPYRTPPFIGKWEDPIGMGVVKKKEKGRRSTSRKKQPIQGRPRFRMDFVNKPLSNFDLINWVKQLRIKHFRGVFSRDDLQSQINEPEVGIINLDTHSQPGTHWVCYRNVDKHYLEYFDSFGLPLPTQIQIYLQTSDKRIIYSTDEIQERDSVLCGFWVLYFLLERQRGKSILNIIHKIAFSQTDKSVNHRFIINYFKNM